MWNKMCFWGTWNGTGTERVPVKILVERNGTSSKILKMERNGVHDWIMKQSSWFIVNEEPPRREYAPLPNTYYYRKAAFYIGLLVLKFHALWQTQTRLLVSSRSRCISWSRSRSRSRFRDILSLGPDPGLGLEAGTFFGPLCQLPY